MKRKGITIWELYLERIVLGVAVLFFLGFVVFQLISTPNASSDGTLPSQVDDQLRGAAEDLRSYLDTTAAPTATIPPYEPVLDRFQARIDSGVTPVERLALAEFSPSPETGESNAPGGDNRLFYVPEFPAVTSVVADQNFGALDPEAIMNSEALAAMFSGEGPHDVSWNTVYGVLPIAQYRAELEQSEGETAALPPNWHGGMTDIFDVVVEREERIDGKWQNRKTTRLLPDQYSLRPRLEDDPTRSVRDAMQEEIRQPGAQVEILRPRFFPLISEQWTPIDPRTVEEDVQDETMSEDEMKLRRLENRLRKTLDEIAGIEKQLKDMDAPVEPPAPERPGRNEGDRDRGGRGGGGEGDRRAPPGGGIAPPGAGGGLGAAGGEGSRRNVDEERKKNLILKLQKNRKSKLDNVERRTREINAMREQLAMPPLGQDAVTVQAIPDDPMTADEIVIWGHDLDVKDGGVYRYRFTVRVSSPFFARPLDLVDEQKGLAEDIVIDSTVSEWSPPVEVTPPTRVFVTRAFGSPQGSSLRLGRATAEVYRFLGGRWWEEKFNLEPGERVGDVRDVKRAGPDAPPEVDYGTNWFVLDIVDDLDSPSDDRAAGFGAQVILQHAEDSERLIVLDPATARIDPDREWLRQQVEQADEAVEVAAGIP